MLHVGRTDYPITRSRIEENRLLHRKICKMSSAVIGIDNDKDGIKFVHQLMRSFVIALTRSLTIWVTFYLLGLVSPNSILIGNPDGFLFSIRTSVQDRGNNKMRITR